MRESLTLQMLVRPEDVSMSLFYCDEDVRDSSAWKQIGNQSQDD